VLLGPSHVLKCCLLNSSIGHNFFTTFKFHKLAPGNLNLFSNTFFCILGNTNLSSNTFLCSHVMNWYLVNMPRNAITRLLKKLSGRGMPSRSYLKVEHQAWLTRRCITTSHPGKQILLRSEEFLSIWKPRDLGFGFLLDTFCILLNGVLVLLVKFYNWHLRNLYHS